MSGASPNSGKVPDASGSGATGDFDPSSAALELVRVLDQYLADLQAGRNRDPARLLEEHPQLASQLKNCLAGIEFVHQASNPVGDMPTQLGESRIVREIGRGGMGVVYEAEQISLKRKVALKVLRFGGVATADALQRFQREGETVAGLHHTNIVPIFAFGCEQGVHYYAMQFIEGESLASAWKARFQTPGPPPINQGWFQEVARWSLQAAEGLAHAHQRGVIHRDIKPSNLLLDQQGTVWLTDFGLAKRLDDVSLTLAGVLVGTPRYMSPEQASAVQQPLDQRTDIYSLGATLYELATGRPAFDAESPREIISHILTTDPVAPRILQPGLPRDLETIILKCLAKIPSRRYETAQQLAEDLRAFTEGRAIKARRASLLERGARWARKQRKSGLFALAGAVLAALFVAGGIVGWNAYQDAQLGWLTLTSIDGTPWTAEIFPKDRDDELIARFTLPTQQPLSLPAGWYRVRVLFPGRLSETYQILVEQGVKHDFAVGVNDRQLWEPLKLSGNVVGVEPLQQGERGHTDLVVVTEKIHKVVAGKFDPPPGQHGLGFRWIDGRTGKLIWERSPEKPEAITVFMERNSENYWFARAGPELNGDGMRDLLVGAGPAQPDPNWPGHRRLVAISGKDGSVLWERQLVGDEDRGEEWQIVCPPVAADVNGDGRPDLILVLAHGFPAPNSANTPDKIHQFVWRGTARVVAVSGRTGRLLWRHDLGEQTNWHELWLQYSIVQTVAAAATGLPRPFPSLGLYLSRPWPPPLCWGKPRTWLYPDKCVYPDFPRFAAVLSPAGRTQSIVVGAFEIIANLDVRTGHPLRPVYYLDMPLLGLSPNGELGLASEYYGQIDPISGGIRLHAGIKLAAISTGTSTVSWQNNHVLPPRPGFDASQSGGCYRPLPLIEDLDGDGKPEVVFPNQVIDGATGVPRWTDRYSNTSRAQGEYFRVIGPDVDGDGFRDIFTTTWLKGKECGYPQGSQLLRFETRSGVDGHTLARFQTPIGHWLPPFKMAGLFEGSPKFRCLPGNIQATPKLIMDYLERPAGGSSGRPKQTAIFSADGRLENLWPKTWDIGAADFDGDGVSDLWGLSDPYTQARLLYGARGSLPEIWRRPGIGKSTAEFGNPVNTGARIATPPYFIVVPTLRGNSDGDDMADVIVFRSWENTAEAITPVAYSGKDGHRLWQVAADQLWQGKQAPSKVNYHYHWLECRDLKGAGTPDLCLFYYAGGVHGEEGSSYIAVVSGRTGKVRWRTEVSADLISRPGFADVTGDGVLDLIVPVLVKPRQNPDVTKREAVSELLALDGRDGTILWRRDYSNGKCFDEIPFAGPVFIPYSERPGVKWRYPLRNGDQAEISGESRPATSGKVEAFNVQSKERLWAWDIAGWKQNVSYRVFEVLQPTTEATPTDVVVVSGDRPEMENWQSTVFGLDGQTGRPRWRCDGRGRVLAILPAHGQNQLPCVIFHANATIRLEKAISVCHQALPAGPDGSYLFGPSPSSTSVTSEKVAPWTIPLPWQYAAQERLRQAFWPGLGCLAIIAAFALGRRWRAVACLTACSIGLPLLVGIVELSNTRSFDDEKYGSGWHLLWPYALTGWKGWALVGNPFPLMVVFSALMAVSFFWAKRRPPASARCQP